MIDLFRAAGAFARRVRERLRQRAQARAAHSVLRRLDDRTLRDLGFFRSELSSVGAEVSGEAEVTRVRAAKSLRILKGRFFNG
jgi:uncharacterized protein YjiS (DUF1127 family)